MHLTPAQQQVLDLLRRPAEPVVFDPGLASELAESLDEQLASVVAPRTEPLWVAKHALATVHGCEGHYIASVDEPFAWTLPMVRGTVAHKAIELSLFWRGELHAMVLVEEALERLAEGDLGAAGFLQSLDEGDRAQLLAEANERVATFFECFPRLKPAWAPVTESKARVEVAGGAVVLSGKVDLTLGTSATGESRKVLIDLKSGQPVMIHRDDLRFYALLETLKFGVPPRLVATYYLDAARAQPEVVTEHVLEAAVHRVVDGVHAIVELRDGRDPVLRPSATCRWCPRRESCDEGQAWLAERDGDW